MNDSSLAICIAGAMLVDARNIPTGWALLSPSDLDAYQPAREVYEALVSAWELSQGAFTGKGPNLYALVHGNPGEVELMISEGIPWSYGPSFRQLAERLASRQQMREARREMSRLWHFFSLLTADKHTPVADGRPDRDHEPYSLSRAQMVLSAAQERLEEIRANLPPEERREPDTTQRVKEAFQ